MTRASFPMDLDISILSACRTPLGGFQGSLANESASTLGAVAVRGGLNRAGVADAEVSEFVMGNVLPASQPTKRFVGVDEIAALPVFLCGESAGSITGAATPIDGGGGAR